MNTVYLNEVIDAEAAKYMTERGIVLKYGSAQDEEGVIREMQGCAGVIVRRLSVSRRVIEACPDLRIIAKHGAGYDSIDVAAAREHGITVSFTPTANIHSVAEHAMALILACARQLRRTNLAYAEGNYGIKDSAEIHEISGKTLGLLGCGRVASDLAAMAKHGFGMRVISYDAFKDPNSFPETVERCETLDELLAAADFFSIHIPSSPENRRCVGESALRKMKRSAIVINTARGDVLDQAALLRALHDGAIAGAGLDVCDPEPAPQDSELFRDPRVVLTPHCGGASAEAMQRVGMEVAEGLVAFFSGGQPQHIL